MGLSHNQPANNAKIYPSVSPWLASLAYPLGSYFVLPGFFGKISITGKENIPLTGPLIVAPTHRSRWDALIVPCAAGRLVSGRDMRYMVSADEMKGIQGWFIKRLGGFPVDTRHPGASSMRRSVEILSQGEMLVIFPEGGIFRSNTVQTLKEGIGRIALQVQSRCEGESVKVLPVSLRYSQEIPSWGTDVFVDIGKPFDVSDYTDMSGKKGAKKLMNDLEVALKSLHEMEVSSGSWVMGTN